MRMGRIPGAVAAAAAAVALALAGSPAAAGDADVAAKSDFAGWLGALREEAAAQGVAAATLDAALLDVQPIERVIELDRRQPEFTLTLRQYLDRYATDTRIGRGREELVRRAAVLQRVRESYGVQPRFVVALWGVESNFGRDQGSFPVIAALATLAYDGRRAKFFRGELLDALRILDEGHVDAGRMQGSWAGAMGQSQFMPSSFRRFAVDLDGDGRRDIWGTTDDVLASIANYLEQHGWRDDQTWGREVRLPRGFDAGLIGLGIRKTLPEWQRLGVRRANGGDLPTRPLPASLIRPDPEGPAYLVYENFRVLMRWNRSEYFGIGVGVLSDRLSSR